MPSMNSVYLAWGLYVAAWAAHFAYWSIAPAMLTLRRNGVPNLWPAQLFWPIACTQLTVLTWPLFATTHFREVYEPRILTMLLMTGGAAGAGFAVHLLVAFIWAMRLRETSDAGVLLVAIAKVASLAAPLAIGVAYLAVAQNWGGY
jgi:hypothetical protein